MFGSYCLFRGGKGKIALVLNQIAMANQISGAQETTREL